MITRYLPFTLWPQNDSDLPSVSGRALRAAAARALSSREGAPDRGEEFRRLIYTEQVRFLNARRAGQVLQGAVAFTGPEEAALERDMALVREALGSMVVLGRGKSGVVAGVEFGPPRDRESDHPYAIAADLPPESVTRVELTSDYLGRHPLTGQTDPTAFPLELRRRLGDRIAVLERYQRFRHVGGHSRTWGLDRAQGLALEAGSYFVIKATHPLPLEDLRAVENLGLGERRSDGFGRVMFLKPMEGSTTDQAALPEEVRPPTLTPPPLLQTLQRRLLEAALEQRVLEAAALLWKSATTPPSRRLLHELRVPLRKPPRDALADLRKLLTTLSRPARAELHACLLGEPPRPLAEWLAEAADGDLSALLGYDDLSTRYHFASAETARATLDNPGFAARVRLRLIGAVLALLGQGVPAEAGGVP